MGNIEFTKSECEKEDLENQISCEQLKRHDAKMYFINVLGEVLEEFVYAKSKFVAHRGCHSHTSPFQLFGHCLKEAASTMKDEDAFKASVILVGRTEKVLGQLECRLAEKINAIFLVPIQRIRIYYQNEITPISQKIIELSSKFEEKRLKGPLDQKSQEVLNLETDLSLYREILKNKMQIFSASIDELKYKVLTLVHCQLDFAKRQVEFMESLSCNLASNETVALLSAEWLDYKKSSLPPEDFRKRIKDAKKVVNKRK